MKLDYKHFTQTNAQSTIYNPYDPTDITTWYGYDNQGFTQKKHIETKKVLLKVFLN